MIDIHPAIALSADVAGRALSLLINRVYGRGASRPLHPRGQTSRALWRVTSCGPHPVGVPAVDEVATRACTVRHSRAVGLPALVPDIEGLAIRLEGQGGGDLLLASTGSHAFTRHLLIPRTTVGVCSTLLPMRTPTGALLLRATPAREPATWDLSYARPGRPWHTFGVLTLQAAADSPPPFDPIHRLPDGLSQYDAVARLRRPAYARAARQRDMSERATDPSTRAT